MKFAYKFPFYNLLSRPLRSLSLLFLALCLASSVMARTLLLLGFNSRLNSLGARLGADIIVVPQEETSSHTIESILLHGEPGYFYINRSVLDQVSEILGVQIPFLQFYLASIDQIVVLLRQ